MDLASPWRDELISETSDTRVPSSDEDGMTNTNESDTDSSFERSGSSHGYGDDDCEMTASYTDLDP